MKNSRQVGFIRTRSSKNINLPPDEPSEFSYFRMGGRRTQQQEFSPYRPVDEPQLSSNIKKPPLPKPVMKARSPSPPKQTFQTQLVTRNIQEKRNNYEQREVDKQNQLRHNIGNIKNKIYQLDDVIKGLKQQKASGKSVGTLPSYRHKKHKFKAEQSSSSEEDNRDVAINSIPSPDVYHHFNNQVIRNVQGTSEMTSHHTSSEHREKFITFNSRTRDQQIAIPNYSSTSEEDPAVEQEATPAEGSGNSLSQQIEEQPQPSRRRFYQQTVKEDRLQPVITETVRSTAIRDVHKNKGGVCFQVNVKDFLPPAPAEKVISPPPKRKQKIDPRAQKLRLREAAKAYDRMARRAVFSSH